MGNRRFEKQLISNHGKKNGLKRRRMIMANEKKNLGGLAFLPLLVFLVLYIGTGVILSIMGA